MSGVVSAQDVLGALRVVRDPDLHDDLVSLGFIHDVRIEGDAVGFEVRLTTPACPAKESLRAQCHEAVSALPGVRQVDVRMTAQTRGTSFLAPELQRALGGVRNVIAVGAGKGGVGKSSATIGLAWALAATGARVGVLDADLQGPSLQRMTGAGVPDGEEARLVPPEVDGVKILSMAMFVPVARATLLRGPRMTSALQQLLVACDWGELDYLLVDLPPGTGDIALSLAQLVPLTGAVLVTTPQEVAVLDARRAIHLFRTVGVAVLGVVETMSGFRCGSCDTLHPIFGAGGGARLAAEAGAPLLGQIPFDPAQGVGADEGRPSVSREGHVGEAWTRTAGQLAAAVVRRLASRADVVDGYALSWSELADGEGVGEQGVADGDAAGVVRAGEPARVRGLWRASARAMGVWWTTGRRATYDAVRLRSVCPCASCVDERTGRRTLRPEDIAPDLTLEAVRAVGSYAMSIRFSDGHETGIYPYDRLAGWDGA